MLEAAENGTVTLNGTMLDIVNEAWRAPMKEVRITNHHLIGANEFNLIGVMNSSRFVLIDLSVTWCHIHRLTGLAIMVISY